MQRRTARATQGLHDGARWVNIHEGEFDEEQMADWIRQSAALPGWDGF